MAAATAPLGLFPLLCFGFWVKHSWKWRLIGDLDACGGSSVAQDLSSPPPPSAAQGLRTLTFSSSHPAWALEEEGGEDWFSAFWFLDHYLGWVCYTDPSPTCLLPSRLLITPQSSSSNALLSGMFSSPPSGLPLAPGPSPWFPLGTTSSVPAAPSRHDLVMPPGTLPGLWRTLWEPDEAQGHMLYPRQLGLESCSAQGNSPPAESCGKKGQAGGHVPCHAPKPVLSALRTSVSLVRAPGKSHNL